MHKEKPVYELAYEDYLNGLKFKDIAIKYNVSESTVRSWKNRYWKNEALQRNLESAATKRKSAATSKDVKRPEESFVAAIDQDKGLTEKQQLFCIYYVQCFNATQAAINAGYTEKYPSEIGYQLLQKTKVRNEIEKLKALKKEAIMLSEEDIVERHMRIAFGDIGNYTEWGQEYEPVTGPFGSMTAKDAVTGDNIPLMKPVNTVKIKESVMTDTSIVREVKQDKNGVVIKLYDSQKSMDWLEKHFLMNPLDKHRLEYYNKKLELQKQKLSGKVDLDSLVDDDELSGFSMETTPE